MEAHIASPDFRARGYVHGPFDGHDPQIPKLDRKRPIRIESHEESPRQLAAYPISRISRLTQSTLSPSEWGAAYAQRRRLYDSFSGRLRSLIIELLSAEGINAVQVDARAKDVQSFIEKIARRPGEYRDPLTDITDLSGVRVIVYYSSDVERVDSLIEREFTVDRDNSWRRTPVSDPDRFGYRSDHYVVSCSASRASLGEWKPYQGLKAEIQVRTVLQHAWAAIDHRLNYKRADEIPVELKRQLFRISALLEVADDQFEAVRLGAERLSGEYKKSVSSGELDLPIDRDSMTIYVEGNARVQHWGEVAARVGFNLSRPPGIPDDDDDGGITALTLASQLSGFVNLAELDEFLDQVNAWGEDALAALRPAGSPEWYVTPPFIIASLLYIRSDLSREELLVKTRSSQFYVDGILKARSAIKQ